MTNLLIDFLRGRGDGVEVVASLITQRRLRLMVIQESDGLELRLVRLPEARSTGPRHDS